jgi:hypothetical protein
MSAVSTLRTPRVETGNTFKQCDFICCHYRTQCCGCCGKRGAQ